jgi:two-component system sensor kinase FixL
MKDSNPLEIQTAVLAAILENAVDAIINITPQGTIDSVNPAAVEMFGFSADEMIGRNIKMLMPNPYRDEHDGYLAKYNAGGPRKIIGVGREVTGQRKNGSTFPMHLAVSEIKVDDKHLFTGIVRDISDLKCAQQELAAANEQLEDRVKQRTAELREAQADLVRAEKFATLGKVSGGIAHEIRNPLNAVKTSAYYLLNAKSPSEDKIREHLERIDRQVSTIDNVVTALSDVAKLPDANLKATRLGETLRTAVGSVGLPSRISVEFEFGKSLPDVLVDESQIMIAFKNLIRNARDAMPGKGTLSLQASTTDDSVSFHFSDTGTGISTENLERILEPLFTTKARGMGLGLSITRAIVEKNKGQLSVESEVGKGSCFTITLSRAAR